MAVSFLMPVRCTVALIDLVACSIVGAHEGLLISLRQTLSQNVTVHYTCISAVVCVANSVQEPQATSND